MNPIKFHNCWRGLGVQSVCLCVRVIVFLPLHHSVSNRVYWLANCSVMTTLFCQSDTIHINLIRWRREGESKREKVINHKERRKKKKMRTEKKKAGREIEHNLHFLVGENSSSLTFFNLTLLFPNVNYRRSAAHFCYLREESLSHFGSYPSLLCNQGQMRSITTVTISMTTSPAAIIGHVVKETARHIMGCRLK